MASQLESRISKLLEQMTSQLVALVRQEFQERLSSALGTAGPVRAGRGGRVAAPAEARPKRILPCRVPGCKNPSTGPRFRYLCRDHRGLPKEQLDALMGGAGNGAQAGEKPARSARKSGRKAAARAKKKAS